MSFNADEYLAHHGIKGQKWGVRRFQNSDGSLTAAGKQRYGSSDGKSDTPEWDHSKSNKTPAARLAVNVALDLITLNPVGLALDIKQGVDAISASAKESSSDKRKAGAPVDPKTGLHLKVNDMSPEQDLKAVNPGYKNLDNNTKNNCMLCTTAYEMRRRGYDVTANKASYGYKYDDVNNWFPKAKMKRVDSPVDNGSVLKAEMGMNRKLAKDAVDALSKEPSGSRGNIMVTWSRGSGHSMAYEVSEGNVVIRDGQTGKTYKKPEAILRNCVTVNYARLDNVKFDSKRIKEAVS